MFSGMFMRIEKVMPDLCDGPYLGSRHEPSSWAPWRREKGPFLPFLCWHCEAVLSAQAHCSAGSSSGAKSLLTWGENAPSSQLMHREQDSELLLLLTVPPPAPADYSRTADAFFWKTAGLSRCGIRITLLLIHGNIHKRFCAGTQPVTQADWEAPACVGTLESKLRL